MFSYLATVMCISAVFLQFNIHWHLFLELEHGREASKIKFPTNFNQFTVT